MCGSNVDCVAHLYQMLVVAYRETLRLVWLRALHRVSGLVVFGIAGTNKYACTPSLPTASPRYCAHAIGFELGAL